MSKEETLGASSPSRQPISSPQAACQSVSAGQPSFSCPCPCRAQLPTGSPWPLLNGIGLRTVLLSQVTSNS